MRKTELFLTIWFGGIGGVLLTCLYTLLEVVVHHQVLIYEDNFLVLFAEVVLLFFLLFSFPFVWLYIYKTLLRTYR